MSFLDFFDGIFGSAKDPDHECSKNPQDLWGIFKWSGEHHFKQVALIRPWGALDWHDYEVQITCALCGVTIDCFGVTEAKLVKYGVSVEKLAECRRKEDWVKVIQNEIPNHTEVKPKSHYQGL